MLMFASLHTLAENELVLNLNSSHFLTSDNFSVVVKNSSHETISYISVEVERLVGEQWESIRADIECPCSFDCDKFLTKLKSGESKTYTWYFRDNNCAVVSKGTYRTSVSGDWDEEKNRRFVLGRSTNFTISR